MILTFAAIEASLISVSWSRRSRMRRQQILMGGSAYGIKSLPILDRYFKQQTGTPTKLQTIAAQSVSAVIRQAAHTQAFEYLVLRIIQCAAAQARKKSVISKVEVVL
jgi:hypothetical protein